MITSTVSMADEAQSKALADGLESWKRWRAEHPGVRPELRGVTLRRALLADADLAAADLTGASLEGSVLTRASLCGATLVRASLAGLHAEGDAPSVVSLRKAELATMSLGGTSVTWTNLNQADLREADLTDADLSGADLRRTQLSGARLDGANLTWANLDGAAAQGASFRQAQLHEAYVSDARLDDACLAGAHLEGAKLERTSLRGADLTGANLCRASLVAADIDGAILNGCFVHGIAAWNLQGTPKEQLDLVITRSFPPYNEPILTVDDLEIAQFIYLLLNNQKIRGVIDTLTSRAVLVLGRFTPARKAVLEAVRDALRARGYVPLLFDFVPSESRDLTETVHLLASLAKFVIADLTDAKSVPQELSVLVPSLPSVPVRPLLLASEEPYAMFPHFQRYPWVLPILEYRDRADLIARFDEDVIAAVENYRTGSPAAELEQAKRKIEELERRLAARGAGATAKKAAREPVEKPAAVKKGARKGAKTAAKTAAKTPRKRQGD